MITTSKVLDRLGITYSQLNNGFNHGWYPRPKNKIGLSFIWTESEVRKVKEYFDGRKK